MSLNTVSCTIVSVGLLVLPLAPALGDVKPHPLFGDHMVLQNGRSVPVWGWADAGEQITVRIRDQEATTTADEQRRWSVRFAALEPGGPVTLTIRGKNSIELEDVLVGEVWVASGQSNMQWPLERTFEAEQAIADSANAQIRLFTVPRTKAHEPRESVGGQWVLCGPETTPGFSAVAYYFGRDLEDALNVPVGLIHTSWGGSPAEAWMSRPALEAYHDGRRIEDLYRHAWARFGHAAAAFFGDAQASSRRPRAPWRPCELYNGMIAPLLPYAIRGAIWYQGESNAGRAWQYRTLFPAMIQNWRESWRQGDFPFLFVQLAPFREIKLEPTESDWAELREAQLHTTKVLANTAMAVITDVGEEHDIHPQQKEPVGARLALAARAVAYGQDIVYSGPVFSAAAIDGDRVTLHFAHVGGGLVARGGPLRGFTVAGRDRRFVNAEADIVDDTVVVRSPDVPEPVAVRYGWADYSIGNLWNTDGLPASPFRTDDFPLTTMPDSE